MNYQLINNNIIFVKINISVIKAAIIIKDI